MKALIVDDESLPGKLLEEQIKIHCPEIAEISRFTSPIEALNNLESNSYDIIFLDVEMPTMTCFDFLKNVQLPPHTSVIIVTAHANYAVEAFKIEVLHYLLKPIDPEELVEAVGRVKKLNSSPIKIEDSPDSISIYSKGRYFILKKELIKRLEADGSYTNFYLKDNRKVMVSKRIGHFEKILESPPFFRCHNSHLVNAILIISIDGGRSGLLHFEDGVTVPVSSHYKPALKKYLGF